MLEVCVASAARHSLDGVVWCYHLNVKDKLEVSNRAGRGVVCSGCGLGGVWVEGGVV